MGTITLSGLGKAYKQYSHPAGRLMEWFGGRQRHALNWILRDIDLCIGAGESVGVVGCNGAGKSTLLKLISGVSIPTEGSVALMGRTAALLELGMGFHPLFTGRQNVYMQGYLQGLGHAEIDALMPEITAFAEIGDYLDRPVRIYSSGMQVRLAFSVATAVRPDILIVDEALAVGDAYFQHKCFDRIRRYRREGTTLLFVSHDPSAVKSLCDRAVLMDRGGIVKDGNPAEVLDYYNAAIVPDVANTSIQEGSIGGSGTRSGTGAVRIQEVELESGGKSIRAILAGWHVSLKVVLHANQGMQDCTFGLLIKDRLGNDIFGTNTHHLHRQIGPLVPGQLKRVMFDFPVLNLGPGHYSVTLAVHAEADHLAGNYDWWERALLFQVIPAEGPHTIGVCHMPVDCCIEDIVGTTP